MTPAFTVFSHTDRSSNSSLDSYVDPWPPEIHISWKIGFAWTQLGTNGAEICCSFVVRQLHNSIITTDITRRRNIRIRNPYTCTTSSGFLLGTGRILHPVGGAMGVTLSRADMVNPRPDMVNPGPRMGLKLYLILLGKCRTLWGEREHAEAMHYSIDCTNIYCFVSLSLYSVLQVQLYYIQAK